MTNMVAALASLCLVMWFSGCGLGTEVGNGFKPRDDDSGRGQKATAAKDGAEDAPEGTTASADVPPVDDEDMSTQTADNASDAAASVTISGQAVDLGLFAAHCASPFAADLASPIDLSDANPDGAEPFELKASFDDASAAWSLKNKDEQVLLVIKKDAESGADAVLAGSANGSAITDSYTCSAVITELNVALTGFTGTYTKRSVELTKASSEPDGASKLTTLTWYLVPASETSKAKLVKLSITPDDAALSPLVLESK